MTTYTTGELELENKRIDIVDDWFDTCRSDNGFLLSILQDRAREMTKDQVEQAWAEAFDHEGDDE